MATEYIAHVESLSPAEQLLVSFLAQRSRPDDAAFDALCTAHPHLDSELRRVYAEWSRLDRVLGARGVSPSPGQPDRPPPQIDPTALADLLAKLGEHSAKRSRYQVEQELARGGMGLIYKVWDPDLHRHVAMKVLRRRRSKLGADGNEERVLGRFLEEAQITGQLEHPGIVPVHELGADEEAKLYFTMPLVRGRELKEVIELARGGSEGWNRTKALGVFLKVCEAVAYAHSKGVLHRDLKPSNVMVGRFGEAYVMDWGLARVMGRAERRDLRLQRHDSSAPQSELIETDIRTRLESTPDSPLITLDGAVIGTPAYMAPEQAEGRIEELGPRADVYSIGAMLYQLLTGQMPYVPSGSPISPHTVLAARLLGPPKPVLELAPDASPELAAICEKAMHSDARRRYPGALELAADIEAYLGHRPVSAFESSLGHVFKLACKRNQKLAIGIASVVVLAIAWGVIDVVRSRGDAVRADRLRAAAVTAEASTRRAADFASVKVLRLEADELYPATPERVPAMRAWLARVDDVESRGGGYRAGLLASPDSAELAACVADLEWLAGERERVADRAQSAEHLIERTVDAQSERWNEAIASIASLPIYGGLKLAPQAGLVPLQLNPQSGLWEFWVDGTGEQPKIAGAATGRLALEPASALVLVLIPGGEFASALREQRDDLTYFDRPLTVKLDPYFIGRTEVPQSVWQRSMRADPAQYQPPTLPSERYTPLLPVEYVTWNDCAKFLARVNLVFPSERQWERAARAGEAAPTAFGCGDDPALLEGRENVFDQTIPSSARNGGAPFADGYELTAPIASFEPNAFGLHDALGNVSEWCGDSFVERGTRPPERGDGLAEYADSRFRCFRGGSFYQPPQNCRISLRQHDQPAGANQTRGLRVARAVR